MSCLGLLLVLCSAFMHAGWNLLARRERPEKDFFSRMLLATAVLGLLPAVIYEVLTASMTPTSGSSELRLVQVRVLSSACFIEWVIFRTRKITHFVFKTGPHFRPPLSTRSTFLDPSPAPPRTYAL